MPAGLRFPRPPIGPDPLRRVKVPRDLATVTSVGEEDDPRRWDGPRRGGAHLAWGGGALSQRRPRAIQLCLRREGRVVLDRAIGHARPDVPVTTGTPFLIYSAAKAVTAMVAHLLDQRGDIHFGDRVAAYIPEYGSHGKHRITVGHILSGVAPQDVAAVGRAEVTGAPVLPPLSTHRSGSSG